MGRLDTIGLRFRFGAAAAAGVCALLSSGAPSNAAEQAAPALVPLSLKGPGSLTGVWSNPEPKTQETGSQGIQPTVITADGKPIPYQPAITKLLEQQKEAKGKPIDAKTAPWCVPEGMPTMMQPPPDLPLQVLETPQQVTMLFGSFGTFRIIHLNEKHSNDPDPTYFGNSVGHWEGNTLVVDTIAILAKAMLFGAPHSEDDMHLVERIHRTDEQTLEDRITITDPKTYTRPWTWVITLKKVPGAKVSEYERRPC